MIYKRNGWYHCDFVVNGTRHRKALKTRDWREAKTEERKLQSEAGKGRLAARHTPLAKQPFPQAVENFLAARRLAVKSGTWKKERQATRRLLEFFKECPLKSIDVQNIEGYRAWRAENGCGPGVINTEFVVLKALL